MKYSLSTRYVVWTDIAIAVVAIVWIALSQPAPPPPETDTHAAQPTTVSTGPAKAPAAGARADIIARTGD